ncbi:MAG: hypothetical protein JJD98_00155 [Polaromonas sp.]|nr:hypothetical protein [Polaromonas sp.]
MIYTPDSYPRGRLVFVNEKEVKACFYADTTRGIARCYLQPFRPDKHKKRILSKTLRGAVRVEP